MSKRTSLGDRLVVEGTIEKQADDNEECERLVEEAEEEIQVDGDHEDIQGGDPIVRKEIETDDDHRGILGGYLIIGKEADDDERV